MEHGDDAAASSAQGADGMRSAEDGMSATEAVAPAAKRFGLGTKVELCSFQSEGGQRLNGLRGEIVESTSLHCRCSV